MFYICPLAGGFIDTSAAGLSTPPQDGSPCNYNWRAHATRGVVVGASGRHQVVVTSVLLILKFFFSNLTCPPQLSPFKMCSANQRVAILTKHTLCIWPYRNNRCLLTGLGIRTGNMKAGGVGRCFPAAAKRQNAEMWTEFKQFWPR